MVVTTAFVHQALVQRAAFGMNEFEPLVITHPLSTLSDEQIAGRIAEVLEKAPGMWIGSSRSDHSQWA